MAKRNNVHKAVKHVPEISDGSPFGDFAATYCACQEQTIEGLREVLLAQVTRFNCDGWMLLECHQMFGSSAFGNLVILPYGPNNTYKMVPTHPISPRGLASDMSVVKAVLTVDQLK